MASSVCKACVVEQEPYGRSLQLTEPVAAGDDIIVEAPYILLSMRFRRCDAAFYKEAYAELSKRQREFVESLVPRCQQDGDPVSEQLSAEEDHFRRAIRINGHSFGGGTTDQTALFEHISMATHSCESNSYYTSNASVGISRLVATRDLQVGDLVTISYISGASGGLPLWPRWKRQEFLQETFSFSCLCSRCLRERDAEASANSKFLTQAHSALEASLRDKHRFLTMAPRHLDKCRAASLPDDGPFHLHRALRLVHVFHISYYHQTPEGDVHLAPAIEALGEMCALLPEGADVLSDCGLVCAVFTCGARVAALRSATATLPVLHGLWRRVGGLVHDCWGPQDLEYQELCKTFPKHGARPSHAELTDALRAVRPCAQCGVAGLLQCGRCRRLRYCSAACQRKHWERHKHCCVKAS